MSNKSFVVSYLIKARDQFSRVTNKYGKQMDKIKRKNREVGDSMSKLSNKVKKLAKVGFAALGASALVALKRIIDVGSEYQTALADLSAITGATGKDLDALSGHIMKMSKTNVVAQKDTVEAVKLMASAKAELLKDHKALVATTSQALLLANASGETGATATLALAGGLNAFSKGADHASKFVDILAAGAQLGASEVADTTAAIKMSGPAAAAAGVDFLQLNVALQALAEKQIKGTQAGTALNAMLTRLGALEIDPKKYNIQDGLKGVDFAKLGIVGGIEKVNKLMGQAKTPFDKAKLAVKLFGLEHQKSGLALLSSIPKMKELTVSMGVQGTAAKQAAINLATYAKGKERIKIAIEEVFIKLFNKIEPALVQITNLVGTFVASFDKSDIEAMSIVLRGLITIIGAVGLALAAFVRGGFAILKPLIILLKGIGETIGSIIAAITTMDFSGLSLSGLKNAFSADGKVLGMFGKAQGTNANVNARIDVGLAKGLEQKGQTQVSTSNTRRADVGTMVMQ